MKKFLLLAVLINIFYGCENMQTVKNHTTAPIHQENNLPQESFFLNDSGITYLLDILSQNIKTDALRNYETGNYFDIYMGEYLSIPCYADTPVLTASPSIQSYDAFIKDGRFYFRSLYQGVYTFSLTTNGVVSKSITINNKAKYKISVDELKNIIYKNYNDKSLNSLKNSSTLFKLVFPGNPENYNISMLLFNLAVVEGNENIVRNESAFLEEKFTLNDADKMKLISGKEKVLNNNYNLSNIYLDYSKNSMELNDYVMRDIIKRSNPTGNELLFLENVYAANQTKDLADIISALYFRAGNVVKGTHYANSKNGILPPPLNNSLTGENNFNENTENNETIPEVNAGYNEFLANYNNGIDYYKDKSYAEAILIFEKCNSMEGDFKEKENIPFYLGTSYMKAGNYEKAKENFLMLKDTNENYPEAMYNLGELYHKNGEKDLAVKTLEKNRDSFPGTIWGRRSSIYLLKLK